MNSNGEQHPPQHDHRPSGVLLQSDTAEESCADHRRDGGNRQPDGRQPCAHRNPSPRNPRSVHAQP